MYRVVCKIYSIKDIKAFYSFVTTRNMTLPSKEIRFAYSNKFNR